MTKKEAKYLQRLLDRKAMLETRLKPLTPEFAAYVPIKKELNALTWAIATIETLIPAIRNAVADYMYSEGCSCCRNDEDHAINKERLAKLLDVDPYDDNSGYNFSKYRTP